MRNLRSLGILICAFGLLMLAPLHTLADSAPPPRIYVSVLAKNSPDDLEVFFEIRGQSVPAEVTRKTNITNYCYA